MKTRITRDSYAKDWSFKAGTGPFVYWTGPFVEQKNTPLAKAESLC